METLRNRLEADLKLRGYAASTQRSYVACVRSFVNYHGGVSPMRLGETEVVAFLLHLVEERKVSASHLTVHIAALKFFYSHTLQRPEEVVRLTFPRQRRPLPDPLSPKEVKAVLDGMARPLYRMVLMCAYAAGLRIGEACSLKSGDIDSQRGVIHVRNAKGGRDRFVMLSPRLLVALRTYWVSEHPPGPYLFPGKDPRQPITTDAVRAAMKKVTTKLGFKKKVGPHTLRHSFAIHLLDNGTDLATIKVLLGHRSVRTTMKYLNMGTKRISRTVSPLENLDGDRRPPSR